MRTLIIALILTASATAQTMRDSSATMPITARQAVIIVSYGGVQVRDTVTAEQVAAWITVRGGQRDTLSPVRDMLSHLRAEVGRCHAIRLASMTEELGLVDLDDSQTLAQIRAARTAIRLRYRQWSWLYSVKVPVLEPVPIGEGVK